MTRREGEHYLSCYLTPPGPFAVFSVRHDQNVALWFRPSDRGAPVELVRLWEVERISGQKHHFWPLYTVERASAFLNALLAPEGLTLDDVTAVWGTPGLPSSAPLPIPSGAGDFPVHSLAHLFSGLMLDTRLFKQERIVSMAIDALPDYVQESQPCEYWYAGSWSDRGSITFAPVESPAPLYTAAETMFGQEPGTLMALASACATRIGFDAAKAVEGITLFGGRVQPWKAAFTLVRAVLQEAERQLPSLRLDGALTREENLRSAVMKVVQECSELVAIRNVEKLLALGGVPASECYLSTSGGYALNCPTNTLLMDRFGFKGLLTPPCANDSGQGIGLGLLGLWGNGMLDRADTVIDGPYQGRDVTDVDEALAEFAPWVESVDDFEPSVFVQDITEDVVAWVDGRAEMGPRALGHRSLLGDPRTQKTKDALNGHKKRQWWRPVAPIVLAESVGEWFDPDRHSPYMLEAVRVRDEARDRIPAVVHLDGSARHQVLTREANPLLHRAVSAFHEATGVPVLCNTSLNDKGESIVDTAAEALTFCVRKRIKVLYLCGRRVRLQADPPGVARPEGVRPRAIEFFAGQEDDRDALWQGWLDRGYTVAGMFLLARDPQLRAEGDLATPERVNLLAEYRAKVDPTFAGLVENFRRTHGPGASFIDPSTLTGAFGVVNPLRRSA